MSAVPTLLLLLSAETASVAAVALQLLRGRPYTYFNALVMELRLHILDVYSWQPPASDCVLCSLFTIEW